MGKIPECHFNHISIVVMAFKCHTGLDTCITITPGACPYTSIHKKRAPLSLHIPEQSKMIPEERGRASMSTRELAVQLHLSFSITPHYLFLLANDLERDGSCRAKPQLSGRRSHRWAGLSQLNPQAAGSDDAQDASYQQDLL